MQLSERVISFDNTSGVPMSTLDGQDNAPLLIAQRDEIAHFVNALFRYADAASVVGLRSFEHEPGAPPLLQGWPVIGADLSDLVDQACQAATNAANAPRPMVFAPPVATFSKVGRANEENLANGVALSVEIDKGDTSSQQLRLEHLLGPATVVVASGGTWTDPVTGECFNKLHLHWRLSEPTRTPVEHLKLKAARRAATLLVGADGTAVPAVHPLRWPGSWHRKDKPRLAMIAGGDDAAQIHLDAALELLDDAVEAAGLLAAGLAPTTSSPPAAPIARLRSALRAIGNADLGWDEWIKVGLCLFRATGGSAEGLALWSAWSAKAPKHVDGDCDERWAHFATSPPTRGGAGTIIYLAKRAGWNSAQNDNRFATSAQDNNPGHKHDGDELRGPAPAGNAWMADLGRSQSGVIHGNVSNANIIAGHDAALKGLIVLDEFAQTIVLMRPPPIVRPGAEAMPGPYPRPLDDADVSLVQGYLQATYHMKISLPTTQQAVVVAAKDQRSHPVRDYLHGLVWDGVERIDTWLHIAFGAPDDLLTRTIGAHVLTAAVRRIFQPGVKFDTVLVLEGDQGIGKSRSCEALFGSHWYTDDLPHDLASKDAKQAMSGKWGVELAELSALTRSPSQVAKSFFSRRTDYFRPPYGKIYVERPRQCVFIGTTNDDDYLNDPTGARRYWPIRCHKTEAAWIAEVRDQLWAEAVLREGEGGPIWLETEDLNRQATIEQAERNSEDVWTLQVEHWLSTQYRIVRVSEILVGIGIPNAQQDKRAEIRVTRILKALKWRKVLRRTVRGENPIRGWEAPEDS